MDFQTLEYLLSQGQELGILSDLQVYLMQVEFVAGPVNEPWPPQMQNWIREVLIELEMDDLAPETALLH